MRGAEVARTIIGHTDGDRLSGGTRIVIRGPLEQTTDGIDAGSGRSTGFQREAQTLRGQIRIRSLGHETYQLSLVHRDRGDRSYRRRLVVLGDFQQQFANNRLGIRGSVNRPNQDDHGGRPLGFRGGPGNDTALRFKNQTFRGRTIDLEPNWRSFRIRRNQVHRPGLALGQLLRCQRLEPRRIVDFQNSNLNNAGNG